LAKENGEDWLGADEGFWVPEAGAGLEEAGVIRGNSEGPELELASLFCSAAAEEAGLGPKLNLGAEAEASLGAGVDIDGVGAAGAGVLDGNPSPTGLS